MPGEGISPERREGQNIPYLGSCALGLRHDRAMPQSPCDRVALPSTGCQSRSRRRIAMRKGASTCSVSLAVAPSQAGRGQQNCSVVGALPREDKLGSSHLVVPLRGGGPWPGEP